MPKKPKRKHRTRWDKLGEALAEKSVSSMAIVHPYGSLGPLRSENASVPFGTVVPYLTTVASRIHTYTEERHDPQNLAKIATLLRGAKKVVFLGFGYHPKNMELLTQNELNTQSEIWGTFYAPTQTRGAAA